MPQERIYWRCHQCIQESLSARDEADSLLAADYARRRRARKSKCWRAPLQMGQPWGKDGTCNLERWPQSWRRRQRLGKLRRWWAGLIYCSSEKEFSSRCWVRPRSWALIGHPDWEDCTRSHYNGHVPRLFWIHYNYLLWLSIDHTWWHLPRLVESLQESKRDPYQTMHEGVLRMVDESLDPPAG